MSLSQSQITQLEALKYRATLYEATITRPDGERCLLAYCARHSRRGLIDALRQRWEESMRFMGLPNDAPITIGKGSVLQSDNGCIIRFSGRTKRDVILSGDALPYVGDQAGQ